MLLRRIMILMEYEEACKSVNKARQSKYNTVSITLTITLISNE